METNRRDLIAAGAGLTALLAGAAGAQDHAGHGGAGQAAAPGTMEVIHIWADEQGVSHVKRVTVSGLPKPLPVAQVTASFVARGVEDWHQAPAKTFTINTHGDIQGEVGDGTTVAIGKGDLVYLEDTTGKGHITRLLTNVSNLFIQMQPDFDFEAWARG